MHAFEAPSTPCKIQTFLSCFKSVVGTKLLNFISPEITIRNIMLPLELGSIFNDECWEWEVEFAENVSLNVERRFEGH